MTIEEFIGALKAIAENREVSIPAQIHLRGQMHNIMDSLGGPTAAFEYFKNVHEAEAPTYPKEDK